MKQILTLTVLVFLSFSGLTQTDEDRAIDFLNDTLKKDPENVEMLFMRGLGFQEMKQYDKALLDFTRALEHLNNFKTTGKPSSIHNYKPLDSIDILYGRAYCYDQLDSLDKAVADYRYLQSKKPNDLFYSISVVRLFIKRKLHDRAQIEINALKARKDNNERGLVQQAVLFYETSKYAKALAAVEVAIKKYPASIEGLITKGKILVKLKRQQESCKYFEMAKSKMTLDYFGGERGYLRDFERDIDDLKLKYCK